MGIIKKNYNPEKLTNLEAVSSLQKVTMTNPVPAIDQDAEPSVHVGSNVKTTTLVYTNESIFSSGETVIQISPSQGEILIPSRSPHVLYSGNALIPLDPSLEIFEYSSDFSENDNSIHVGSENTVKRLLNPLDYCVTDYNPISPQNCTTLGNSHRDLHFKNNYMSVPKDVPAKVTIKSIPPGSEPQVYCDGKLTQPATDQKKYLIEFTPAASCTVTSSSTVSTNVLTLNDILTGAHASVAKNSRNNNDGSEVYVATHMTNQEDGCNILRRILSGYNPTGS